jgi:hypothetical protein
MAQATEKRARVGGGNGGSVLAPVPLDECPARDLPFLPAREREFPVGRVEEWEEVEA